MIQTEPGKCFSCKSDAPQPKIWQENLETVVKSRLTSRSELIVAARDGQVQDVRSFWTCLGSFLQIKNESFHNNFQFSIQHKINEVKEGFGVISKISKIWFSASQ